MSFKSKTKNFFKGNKKAKSHHKLYLYVIIVNFGLGDLVLDVLEENHSNMHCTFIGKGTASKKILRIMGLEDERKDIIFAFVNEKELKNVTLDLNDLFLKKKRFMGMGFAIRMTSIVGEKIYHFLSNTI